MHVFFSLQYKFYNQNTKKKHLKGLKAAWSKSQNKYISSRLVSSQQVEVLCTQQKTLILIKCFGACNPITLLSIYGEVLVSSWDKFNQVEEILKPYKLSYLLALICFMAGKYSYCFFYLFFINISHYTKQPSLSLHLLVMICME